MLHVQADLLSPSVSVSALSVIQFPAVLREALPLSAGPIREEGGASNYVNLLKIVRVGHLPATLLADERLEDGADLRVVQEGGLAGLGEGVVKGRTWRENKEGGL